jgi:hypothetical protein
LADYSSLSLRYQALHALNLDSYLRNPHLTNEDEACFGVGDRKVCNVSPDVASRTHFFYMRRNPKRPREESKSGEG